jgi:ATP-dependent RNA helicase RhlE
VNVEETDTHSFDQFDLDDRLMRVVKDHGFTQPTPIQIQAIPELRRGKDLIGAAQTGTGKTVAFLLPSLHVLLGDKPRPRRPQMVVLAPTRELALQITDEATSFMRHTPMKVCAVYGGSSIQKQIKQLRAGVDLVVATPGRLMDHMRRGNVQFDDLKIVVLDEADRMLDMGFLPDMRQILREMPQDRQTMMFSATMPAEIEGLANEFLTDPVPLHIKTATPPEAINQVLYPVPKHLKTELLLALLKAKSVESMLVFTRTKVGADVVGRKLKDAGISAAIIHGDYSQRERLKALRRFKENQVKVLVATNLASRGLDIEDISHVVNYDVPDQAEDYVHRIGRTARAQAEGDALTLVTPEDEREIAKIEHLLGYRVSRERLGDFDYEVEAPSWAKPSFEALLDKSDDEEKTVDRWRSLARF